jgi:hypothetical protein
VRFNRLHLQGIIGSVDRVCWSKGLLLDSLFSLERISIEPSTRCDKACWFCYNDSGPDGKGQWRSDELVDFVRDCAEHGLKAVSFGGGEPLQFSPIYEVLAALRGVLFRSLTTNGLLLNDVTFQRLAEVLPNKVQISLHFPGSRREVQRVIGQVHALGNLGIRGGVNLLVRRSRLLEAKQAARYLRATGLTQEQIVYLPMRGHDTPIPRQVADVAGGERFQSMNCLSGCAISPRFCSLDADKRVGWCSYTAERRSLSELTFAGLQVALRGLGLHSCGDQLRG